MQTFLKTFPELPRRVMLVVALLGGAGGALAQFQPPGQSQREARLETTCLTGTVLVEGTVVLRPDCVHRAALKITKSNTVLDCRGSTIDSGESLANGVFVDSQGRPLSDVEIRNCTFVNARGNGVRIGWSAPDSEKIRNRTHEQVYAVTPRKVVLRNVNVRGAGGVGIFIDDYVSDTLLENVEVSGSAGVGIYLEHSSRHTRILHSKIFDNGFARSREGIAVDSSEGNVIAHSRIYNNRAGGVFIYRNCSEHLRENPDQVVRWQSSDNNRVEKNVISGSPVGVWVASRQSRNLSRAQCGNGYYAEGRYTLDSAHNNQVFDNTIENVGTGVIVEDDNNAVVGNLFRGVEKVAVRVGTGPRYKFLGKPVVNVTVSGNKFERGSSEIRFTDGSRP